MFIFERERQSASGGGAESKRGRETQNLKQAPGSELSAQPDAGLELMDCKVMT